MRDKGYRDWIREYRHCAICCGYPCDPAHTVNNGMRSKGPDSSCAPLCREHHREYDGCRKAFEFKYGINMQEKAAEWYAAYLKWKEQQ